MGVYLPGYKIKKQQHFSYYIGSESTGFALSIKPLGSIKRCCQQKGCYSHAMESGVEVKVFNMNALSDCTHSYVQKLSPAQWMGTELVRHTFAVGKLSQDFITSGRIYMEHRMRGFYHVAEPTLKDSKVVKRFYDLHNYKEPAGKSLVERNMGWVIVGIIFGMFILAMFVKNCCWQEKVRR